MNKAAATHKDNCRGRCEWGEMSLISIRILAVTDEHEKRADELKSLEI